MRYSVLLLLATLLVAATLVHSKAIDTNSLHKLHTPVYENCYSHDGINVNKKHVTWGRTGEIVPRLSKAAYLDGVKDPPRLSLSARVISNAFCKQTTCDETNDFNVSSMIYAYGQFVDHDISNEGTGLKFTETLNIEVPAGDVWTTPLPFTRAVFASDKPTYLNEPVNPVNFVTGYMDCSQIYGSDEVRAEALRSKVGGLLKTDLQFGKEFLPKSFVDTNTGLFFIGAGNNTVIAGDNRATEALPISIMQTLFLREHNRLARLIVSRFGVAQNRLTNPAVDSWIYETARTINCAQIQHITYTEYLPRLLGKFSPKPSNLCYDEEVKATVTSEFSTAAFRFGHSTVGCDLKRFLKNGTELTPIDFGAAFNAYPVLLQNNGEEIDNLVRGLVKHHAQNLDEKVVDGLRQQIRGRLDLVARNIQRGRDVGLPDYNTIRQAVGLPPLNVTQITTRVDIQTKLISFWGTNLVGLEPWLGVILEDKVGNSQLGELGTLLLKTQFESFVKGDPCFYSHSQKWATTLFRKEIQKVTLADIIDANTGVKKNEKAMGESPFTAKYGPLI